MSDTQYAVDLATRQHGLNKTVADQMARLLAKVSELESRIERLENAATNEM